MVEGEEEVTKVFTPQLYRKGPSGYVVVLSPW